LERPGGRATCFPRCDQAASMYSLCLHFSRTEPSCRWVEIITWNDFVEGSYASPIDDPNKYANANFLPITYTGYYHSHYAFTDLLKYYIQWYKTGSQPAITQDSVYWFYRTQSMNYNSANGPSVANSA
jgi:glucan endo-1,3-alpha-glucosidase